MKLWSCFEESKIRECIEYSIDSKKLWTIWQKEEKDRNQLSGRLIAIENDKIEIEITAGSVEQIEANESVFCYCTDSDILFKRENFEIRDNLLLVPLPKELKFKDHRLIDRLYYKYQDFKSIAFQNESETVDSEISSYILRDLSVKGLSFVAPRDEISFLEVNSLINIINISDQNLSEPLRSKVIYINNHDEGSLKKRNSKAGRLAQVGLVFDEGLSEVIFKTISSVMQRKQIKMNGLDVQGFNGLNAEEVKRTLGRIIDIDPELGVQISDMTEGIDRLRFLTPQMKQIFWTEVDQAMFAQAIRISSKELIYDLLSDISETRRIEFLEQADKQVPAGAIAKAQRLIIDFIEDKEQKGVFVLTPTSFSSLV